MKTKARAILKDTFGYDEWRPFQEDIISSVLGKQDTLAIMPTGAGKSICYQIPAMIFDGLTIVVSPLISLMKDQIDQMKEIGIPAVMLNSLLEPQEYNHNMDRVRENDTRLLYIAPETLMKPNIIRMLSEIRVEFIAIDESHCISEWGHDFRPEYRALGKLRTNFPETVWLALTATATERVRNDIVKNLKLNEPARYIAPFNRENLFLEVKRKNNPFSQVLEFLKHHRNESGIIYCLARETTERLSERLSEYGFSVKPYHAGLPDIERKRNQDLFLRDEIHIIAATIAFGMGVHKSNIRFIVHYDLPKSIESYYQEIGRAGRDDMPAHCLLLYSYSDTRKIKYFIDQKQDITEKRVAELHLKAMVDYAETCSCRRIPLLTYFGERYNEAECSACDNCSDDRPADIDITREAQMFLSCVKRVNERFGMNYIIDILRGSGSQRIMEFGHNRLSTYGIGGEHSKRDWHEMARTFIRLHLIEQDGQFNVLKLLPAAYDVMKGKMTVLGRKPEEREKSRERAEAAVDYNRELFDILRSKRKELANAENVPPYIVFSDRTLAEMATYYPQHKSAMMDINGMGMNKYEKFGGIFLDIIKEYCVNRGIDERIKKNIKRQDRLKTYKYKIIGDEYAEGLSIDRITDRYNIKLETVFRHLYDYIMNGYTVRAEGLAEFLTLDKEYGKRVLDLFDSLGTERLKPVFEALGGQVNYDTLSVYRLYYMCRLNSNEKLKSEMRSG